MSKPKGMQLGGFVGQFACSRAGADPEIIVSEGRRPSLTNIIVARYLLFKDSQFQLTIPKKLQFPRRDGGVQVLGSVGSGCGLGFLILIPKETYNTCNFPGLGPDLLTPHLSMDS